MAAAAAFGEAEKLRSEWSEPSLREALKRYEEAQQWWLANGFASESAAALERVAEIRCLLGDCRGALPAHQRALAAAEAAGNAPVAAEVLAGLAQVHLNLEESAKALRYVRRAREHYHRLLSAGREREGMRAEARALGTLGEWHLARGELRQALEFFSQSLALWEKLDDSRGQAAARLSLGYTFYDAGDLRKASESYGRSLELWLSVGDRRGEALSRTALGGVFSYLGEGQSAIDAHRRATQLFRAMGDRRGEITTLNGLAQAYQDLNELALARDHYVRALSLCRQLGNRYFEAVTTYYVGQAHHALGEHGQALAFYERSASLARDLGDPRTEAYALMDAGTISAAAGETKQALSRYERVLGLYREIKDGRGQALALNGIGRLHQSSGAAAKALDCYREALSLSRASGDRRGEAAALYNLALVESEAGHLAAALAHVEESVGIVESSRSKVQNEALRTSFFAYARQHYELNIDLLMRMHKLRPGEGYAAAALRASEQARARSLLDTLAGVRAASPPGAAPELIEQESRLQQLLDAKAEYQTRLLGREHEASEAEEVAGELRELTVEYQEVRAKIRAQNPMYSALAQPPSLKQDDVRAALGDGRTLLLEYALGDERSYLWVGDADSVNGFELPPRAVLERAARRVYELLTARQRGADETLAQYRERVAEADALYWGEASALSALLLGPVAARLGTNRLLVVADGALQYVPFEALPSPPGADPAASPEPLLLRHEVVNLPSVSVLLALRSAGARRGAAPEGVAVFADPIFDRDDPRLLAGGAEGGLAPGAAAEDETPAGLHLALRDFGPPGNGLGISRLPFTLREAEAIPAAVGEGETLVATGFDASRAAVVAADLSRYRVVHFATHGLVNSEHPELSGIVLSLLDRRGAPQNGFLRLHDIYNLKLGCELVVLSACSTALGKEVKGEGLVGLAHGFMYAGAENVVASLWQVDDEATAELMKHFYRAMLGEGLTPAAALRKAKTAVRQQPRWRAPYYWAAFIIQGEHTQAAARPRRVWPARAGLAALLVASVFVGGLAFAWRRRRAARALSGARRRGSTAAGSGG